MHYSNTRLVRYSDGYCTVVAQILNAFGFQMAQLFSLGPDHQKTELLASLHQDRFFSKGKVCV